MSICLRRREFVAALGGAVAWPLAARAQQGDRVRRIGVLMPWDENDPVAKTYVSAFTQALANSGWIDGRNVRMDFRVAGGIVPRLDRQGGNITGFEPSLGGKWLELLSEIAPGLKRAAIMFNPDTFPISTSMPSFETAARSSRSSDEEIETGGLYAI